MTRAFGDWGITKEEEEDLIPKRRRRQGRAEGRSLPSSIHLLIALAFSKSPALPIMLQAPASPPLKHSPDLLSIRITWAAFDNLDSQAPPLRIPISELGTLSHGFFLN